MRQNQSKIQFINTETTTRSCKFKYRIDLPIIRHDFTFNFTNHKQNEIIIISFKY